MKSAGLSTPRLIAYSLPIFGIEFIIVPILIVLPSYYAAHGGGSLAAYATAVLVSRIIYSCSGPIVGYASDLFSTRWGRRKPWMLVGLAIATVAALMLFVPPKGAGAFYFGAASALGLFAFSVIDVPYLAWGAEMSRDYETRTRITTYRAALATGASVVFLGLPLVVPGFGGHDVLQTTVINRLGYVAAATIVVTVLAALLFVPEGTRTAQPAPARGELFRVIKAMLTNVPMWWFAGAIICSFLSGLISSTVAIPFLSSLGITGWFQVVTMVSLGAGILSLPLWLALTYRIGKTRGWVLALIVTACSAPLYFVVARFFGPLAGVLASSVIGGLPSSYMTVSLPYSIMGDIIDYDEVRSGRNHSGIYSAVTLLIIRFQTAIGGAIGFYTLSLFGYRIGASNSPFAFTGLYLTYLVLPAIFAIVGILCIWFFPLDERRQAALARELEARAV